MAPPDSATMEALAARLDTCVKRRDELMNTLFPNGGILPEEQTILDRIDQKLQQLQALAAQASDGASGGGRSISAPVGKGGRNDSDDVMTVQQLLNDSSASLTVDGLCGPKTIAAIKSYQQRTFGWNDSLVEPGRETITALTGGGTGNAAGDGTEEAAVSSTSISAPVGKGGRNTSDDVMIVQQLLNDSGASLTVDGLCGPKTIAAIKSYQQRTFGWNDSLVEPGCETITALTGGSVDDGGNTTTGADGSPSMTGTQGADTLEDLPAPEPVPGIGLQPDGANTPQAIEENPNDPQVMEDLIAEQLDNLPGPETIVDITDPNGDVLSFVEFPFLMGQEISLGITVGGVGGTLKIKFNNQGQVETAAVEIPAIPGITIAVSPYAILCKGELKPLSCDFQLKKEGGSLRVDLEVSTSGSMMVGLGAARGDDWAGLGVEVELKVSRTEKVTASLALDMLESALRGNSLAGMTLDFNLPAVFTMSGAQSLVVGASGSINRETAISIGRKLTLRSYPRMITVEVRKNEVKITAYDDLYRMIADHARATFPLLDTALRAYDLAQEINEFVNDPEGYSERKRAEAEEYLRRARAFPSDVRDLIEGELDKLARLDDQIARQLEEWNDDAGDAIDDLMAGAGDIVDGTVEEILEAGEGLGDLVGGMADDLMDAAEDAQRTAEDRLNRAIERAERARDLAEQAAEAAREAAENAGEVLIDEVRDRVEAARQAVQDVARAAQAAREAAENVADDVRARAERALQVLEDRANTARDTAEEMARDAERTIRDAAGEVQDAVEGVASEAAQAAERAVEEALQRAEAARETAEEMARAAREAAENAAENVADEVQELARNARAAAEDAQRAAEAVRDAAQDATEEVRRRADRAAQEALRRAETARDTAEELARDTMRALEDAAGSVQDAAEAIAGAAAAAAERAVNEALERAEAARETAEQMARDARRAAENMAENAVEEAREKARAAQEAVEDAARAAQGVRDAVGDAAEDVRARAERAAEDALRQARAAQETAEEMARDAQRAARRAQGAVEETAREVREAAEDAIDDIQEAAEDAVESAKDKAEEMAEAAQDAAREAQEVAESAAEDILEGAEDALDNARDAAENAAEEALDGAADVLDDAADGLENLADRLRNPFGRN